MIAMENKRVDELAAQGHLELSSCLASLVDPPPLCFPKRCTSSESSLCVYGQLDFCQLPVAHSRSY